MGDGFMALFGVPRAHEEDAERAVRAAIAMRDHVRQLRESSVGWPGPSDLHAGIQTGEVLAVSSEQGIQVIGDAVNTASRFLSVAPAGCVLVGEQTRRLTEESVDYLAWAPIRLKGKELPAQVYQVMAVRPVPEGRHVRVSETPFVGRRREKHELRQLAEEAVGTRSSRVHLVLGPPGAGKSRLVREFGTRLEDTTLLEGRSPPFGSQLPWFALAQAIRAHVGISHDDTGEEARARIRAVVEGAGVVEVDEVAPQLAQLLGYATPEALHGRSEASHRPSPHPASEQALALRHLLENLAQKRPVLVVLEDLQWADEELVGLLSHISRDPWSGPITFLGLSRPELIDQYPELTNVPVTQVERLDRDESAAIVASLLEQDAAQSVVDRVVDRAEGNPLFIEEIVRMLVEQEELRRGPYGWEMVDPSDPEAVPQNLQVVIGARVDALPEEEKRLLQDAAIVGTTFWDDLLRRLGWADVEERLRSLSERDLIRRSSQSSFAGAQEYAFKHALIREVVYRSVTRAARAGKHLTVASWLQERAPSEEEEPVDLLAYHLERSALVMRSGSGERARDTVDLALRYLNRAGRAALSRQSPREAKRLFRRALTLALDASPGREPASSSWVIESRLGLAEASLALHDYPEAEEQAAEARRLAADEGQGRHEGGALVVMGEVQSRMGSMIEARALLEEAGALFARAGDRSGQGWALYSTAGTWRFDDLDRLVGDMERAHRVFLEARDDVGALTTSEDLAYILTVRGGPEFERWFAESQAIGSRLAGARTRARSLRTRGLFEFYRGRLDRVSGPLDEAERLASDLGDAFIQAECWFTLGQLHLSVGPPAAAARYAGRLLDRARELGLHRMEAYGLVLAARVALREGYREAAMARLDNAEGLLGQLRAERERGEVLWARTAVAVEAGDGAAARELAASMEEEARRWGDRLLVPAARLLGAVADHLSGAFEPEALAEALRAADEAGHAGAGLVGSLIGAQAAAISGREAALPDRSGCELKQVVEWQARWAETEGLVAWRSDPARAEGLLRTAEEAWERIGLTVWLARAQALRAVLLGRLGRKEEAAGLVERAGEILRRLGSPLSVDDLVPEPLR
jgi:tetratricopeptide (TPR) repeat protein